jgi:hypothetical protein
VELGKSLISYFLVVLSEWSYIYHAVSGLFPSPMLCCLADPLFLTLICRHKDKHTAADVNVLPDIHGEHICLCLVRMYRVIGHATQCTSGVVYEKGATLLCCQYL